MSKFKCWREEFGEGEFHEVEANDYWNAAEEYARWSDKACGDGVAMQTVCVRSSMVPDLVVRYRVEVRLIPRYTATRIPS